MKLRRIFGARPARVVGDALYAEAARQARQPGFYQSAGVPDTIEGRFELYSLHVVLLLHRLRGEGGAASEPAQALFDAYVGALDNTLREMGVGDLTVPKRMRKLGEAFYGRAKAYDTALAAMDRAEVAALLGRTVFDDAPAAGCDTLTDYVFESVGALAAQPLDAILGARPSWPAVPA